MKKTPPNNTAENPSHQRAHPASPRNAKPVLRLVTHHDTPPRHQPQSKTASQPHLATNPPPLRQGESRRIIEKRIAEESRRAAINPELHPNDPRWILATKTLQSLEGPALNPTRRLQLIHHATKLGIRPFDANLVIAIVQDEARQNKTPADTSGNTFKFKHADFADRLQIIPQLGTPSIRDLENVMPPTTQNPKLNPILRLTLLTTATLALTAALLTLLFAWLFNTTN